MPSWFESRSHMAARPVPRGRQAKTAVQGGPARAIRGILRGAAGTSGVFQSVFCCHVARVADDCLQLASLDGTDAQYGLVMRRDAPELKSALDRAMRSAIIEGTYTRLYRRWLIVIRPSPAWR